MHLLACGSLVVVVHEQKVRHIFFFLMHSHTEEVYVVHGTDGRLSLTALAGI